MVLLKGNFKGNKHVCFNGNVKEQLKVILKGNFKGNEIGNFER